MREKGEGVMVGEENGRNGWKGVVAPRQKKTKSRVVLVIAASERRSSRVSDAASEGGAVCPRQNKDPLDAAVFFFGRGCLM